jgi:ketosteroid isomerase-like protein
MSRRPVLLGLLLAAIVAAPAVGQSASSAAALEVPADVRAALLAVRDTAWRAWFAGERAVLAHMLPEQFIGIGWGDGPWSGRDQTIDASAGFAAQGGKLLRLEFPRTEIQRFGDVAVLYSEFVVEFEVGGQRTTQQGRATEVFVKQGRAWTHPAWHLDSGR